jgi:hypothetical protein
MNDYEMKDRYDECGMENVEVMGITKNNKDEKITLCNQCIPFHICS